MIAYRKDIDGLRTIAILPVVVYHAGTPFVGGGYIGVDVFFVLSGFLITKIIARELDKGEFSLLGFYERRARRILPALLFMVIGTVIAASFVLLPPAFERLGASIAATALFGSNFYFWTSLGYFAPSAEFEPLLHTWSLAVEEQFYIVFPLLMIALYAFASLHRHIAAIIGVICVLSLIGSVVAVEVTEMAAFYLAPFRAWELGLGSLLAVTSLPAVRSTALREALALAALAAILVPVFAYTSATPFPGLAAVPPVVGTAMLVWLGTQENVVSRLLSTRPFVAIGLISYSLYLWHWPILALLRANKASVDLTALEAAIAVALSFALATFSYWIVERPFRQRTLLAKRSRLLAVSAASLVGFSALGVGLYAAQGLPQRLPPEVTRTANAANDISPYREACRGRRPAEGLCVVGAGVDGFETGGEPTDILLWGDSHADALVPAVEAAAQEAGFKVTLATHAACLPIARLIREGSERNASCEAFNDAVLDTLRETDAYPTVILSGRWQLSVEGSRYGEEEGTDFTVGWENPLAPVAAMPRGNPAIMEAALGQTVAAIRATGRRVVIAGPAPEIGWNVPEKLALAQWRDRPAPAVPSAAEVEARTGHSVTILRKVAAQQGAEYVDLIAPVCAGGCKLHAGDAVAFVDDDHLSATAARQFLAPVLDEVLSAARTAP